MVSQQWNTWIAAKIGVDKFNPYEELLGVVPEVPIVPGEFGPEELGLGAPEGPEEMGMGMPPEEPMM